jgi:hypothetical protein
LEKPLAKAEARANAKLVALAHAIQATVAESRGLPGASARERFKELVLNALVPGIRFNEHVEGDGPIVFAMPASLASKALFEAEGIDLPLGTLAGLAQDEASERSGSDAGRRGGLGTMTSRGPEKKTPLDAGLGSIAFWRNS